MERERALTGKWQFIGAEKHSGSKWQPATFVEGMSWEFIPQYFSAHKSIGNIVERAPAVSSIEMEYVYDKKERLLKVAIFTDYTLSKEDKSEADFYDVIFVDSEESADKEIVKLSILTQEGCPLPYFQYILQKIEE